MSATANGTATATELSKDLTAVDWGTRTNEIHNVTTRLLELMEKWKLTGDPQADIPRTILLRVESETLRRLAESSHTIGNRNMDPLADMKTAMARCKFVGAAAYSEAVAEQVSAWTEAEEKKLVEDGSLGTTRSQTRSCESGTRTFRGSQEVKLHEDEIVPYLKRAMAALKSGEECMSYHLDACPSPEEPGASYTRLLQKSEAIKSLQGLRDHFSEVIGPTMMGTRQQEGSGGPV
ncbi:hypothetical protein DB88DRAFT_518038 [Papiliotrema laurentii]|uniref:Uncharacterized protein n=1 Tax=Papiliotrema laurentii TaxID=5418 RepID=A0AAD9FJR9_PAPLA|nr:hypothetical protein DB88DRAFT_518038 [Papiliotrema laurentii]